MDKLPIDLLIFDFDGTLTDSIPAAVEAIQAMIKELGLPFRTKEQIHEHVGFGETPLVSGSIGSEDPALVKKAMDIYFRIYRSEGIKNVRLYPHVKGMLEHFSNKKIVILSNKKTEFIKLILAQHGLTGYFSEIHGGDTAPCLKPDPCAINQMIKRYNIAKDRVLFVGDMTVDIETGKNAGVHTCAVTYGFDDKEKLAKLRPDLIVDDILELKDLIT